ncbi:hypothetical protein K457DRAFT_22287 [Linnemannia elongata AG-77]|uniref:Uncharacterized protein n=1 Tax=Linnemannia elongata AG-77 TaxID=1314771 RepID=A0A197JPD2_9FUNG|nr:hypothetical protein K457DRAFT_22287 [Linnemannia elongata AG-77]
MTTIEASNQSPPEPKSTVAFTSTDHNDQHFDCTKAPSTVTTTITTTDSGNGLATLATMLQSELNRKLAELKDVHEAYKGIQANWTDDKPPTWQYQHLLEEAAAKIEGEISRFQKEILDALVSSNYHSRLVPDA